MRIADDSKMHTDRIENERKIRENSRSSVSKNHQEKVVI